MDRLRKVSDFSGGLYNTFCQNRHESRTFDVSAATDGRYHTLTTEWRTRIEPLPGITDAQVVQFLGYWWIRDKAVSFERYLGNPLKRLERDSYALYTGEKASTGSTAGWSARTVVTYRPWPPS